MKTKLKDVLIDIISGEWGDEDIDGKGLPIIRTTNFTKDGRVDYSNIESLKMRYLKALKTIYNESTTSNTGNPITRDATKRARISQLISEAIRNKAEPTIIQTLRDAFTRPPAGEPDQNKIEEPLQFRRTASDPDTFHPHIC